MKLAILPHKRIILTFAGIFLLAAGLRLINLDSIPIFADEAIYIRWSQVMRAEETLRFLPLSDGKQPLFMWLTIPLLKLINDPLIAGRVVSVLSGIGSLIGISVLSFLLFKTYRLPLIASLVYSVLPFAVFFDRMALADSLLSFFGIWTFIFVFLTIQKIRLDTAMLAGFFLGGALLTKSPGIYLAILIPCTLLLAKWPKGRIEKFKKLSVYVFLFTFTYVIGFAMQNILRLGPNFHMIAQRNADYVYPLSHILNSPFDPLMPFLDRNLEYLWMLGSPFFVILIIVGIYIGLKKFPKETVLLLALSIIPILISSEFSKTMTARYIYPSIPFLVIISSLPFLLLEKAKYLRLGTFVLAFVSAITITQSYRLINNPQSANLPRSERSGYLEEWTSGYGIKAVSEYLRSEYRSDTNSKVVVGTEGYFGTLPDGLQIYLNDVPEITVIGVGQPVRSLPNSLKESFEAGNKTYLVVNNTRLLEYPEKIGLKLIFSYPKAMKSDGSPESLMFFEVLYPH